MSLFELFLMAVGLAMDAFAVSVCKGLSVGRVRPRHMLSCGVYFGAFQALMPMIGYLLGVRFQGLIESLDHWIAFGLLALIGGNMLRDAFRNEPESTSGCGDRLDLKELLLMAIATSIDALAVGISFAFLGVNIWLAIAVIGITTFVICTAGVFVGNRFGTRYQKRAAIAGGVILILLGLKILLEHLGVIAF